MPYSTQPQFPMTRATAGGYLAQPSPFIRKFPDDAPTSRASAGLLAAPRPGMNPGGNVGTFGFLRPSFNRWSGRYNVPQMQQAGDFLRGMLMSKFRGW